jgi:hypothetical protein
MVFSSYIFIFWFLPIAMLIYYSLALAPQRVRNFSLIILGYVFYGWADPRFVVLMFATTFIDWLQEHPGWEVVPPAGPTFTDGLARDIVTAEGFLQTWPQRHGCDGMFAAKLRRCR